MKIEHDTPTAVWGGIDITDTLGLRRQDPKTAGHHHYQCAKPFHIESFFLKIPNTADSVIDSANIIIHLVAIVHIAVTF